MKGLTVILTTIVLSGALVLSGVAVAQAQKATVPAAGLVMSSDAWSVEGTGDEVLLASSRHHRHGFDGRFNRRGHHLWGKHRLGDERFHRHGHRHDHHGFHYGYPYGFYGSHRHFGGQGLLSFCIQGSGFRVCYSDRAYRQPHRW